MAFKLRIFFAVKQSLKNRPLLKRAILLVLVLLPALAQAHPLGPAAAIIGEVVDEHSDMVTMKTRVAVRASWTCFPANNCRVFVVAEN
jgi:hypothetical protein